MDKRKLVRNLIIGTVITAVVVGGYIAYKKGKQSKAKLDLEKQGYKCGECNDAKKIICEDKDGNRQSIPCSLMPDFY